MSDVLARSLASLTRRLAVRHEADAALLVRYISSNDSTAFAELVRRHGPLVLGVCRRMLGHVHDAADAFQATFLVLARNARSVRKPDALSAWLYGTAVRVCHRAAGKRSTAKPLSVQTPPIAQEDPFAEAAWKEIRGILDDEIGRLPETLRAPLILCYFNGLSRDEAAEKLGCSRRTLMRRLEKARERLRRRLERRGVGTAGLGVAVLSSGELSAFVPDRLAAAAVAAGTGGPVSAGVQALAGTGTALKLLHLTVGLMLLAGGGVGLAALSMRLDPHEQAVAPLPSIPQERPRASADARAKPGADMSQPIRSLEGHEDRVTSVAYSPDGRWIATAAWDGTARLWDAQTGKQVRRLDVPAPRDYHRAHLARILFSSDNEFVVAAQQAAPNEAGVIVWKRRTGEKVHAFPAGIGSVAVSPDGRLIACGGYGIIRLYELASGKMIREMRSQQERIESLTFSPNGKTLVSTGPLPRPDRGDGVMRLGFMPDVVRIWDVETGNERRSVLHDVALGGLTLQRLALSPDGRTLAVGSSLLETATGAPRAVLTGHTNDVCGVAFSPDGRTLASGSMDGTARLWDLPSGKEVARFGKEVPRFAGRGWVLAVAFSPDGRTLISGGLDKIVHLWDVSRITGRRREPAERTPADLEADWKDLAKDAATGYAALGRLVSSPGRAIAFLGKQLRNVEPPDTKRIERLIADLDDEQFQVREQATKELEALVEHAAPLLRKALASKPSLEMRRRLVALLDRLDGARPSAETVRQIRAVEVLELIGNAEARRLLEKLAAESPERRLTHEAKAAMGRLAKRASVAP
jgi:RNA polymerase sigma factor (sigma-70 family)